MGQAGDACPDGEFDIVLAALQLAWLSVAADVADEGKQIVKEAQRLQKP